MNYVFVRVNDMFVWVEARQGLSRKFIKAQVCKALGDYMNTIFIPSMVDMEYLTYKQVEEHMENIGHDMHDFLEGIFYLDLKEV